MNQIHYLPNIVILLSAAIFIVVFFRRMHLSPVLGYLVAGAAIGEFGLGFVNSADLKILAEFGVVFLLFAIGLELTIERLMSMRWHVFGFGTAQVLITGTIISCITYYYFKQPIEASIIIGGALALSSTAVVLRVLSDEHLYNTQVGRLSIANLILQDFAVVPLLVLVPLLSSEHTNLTFTLSSAMGKAFLCMILIFILGRIILRPLFKLIASVQSKELFTGVTLLVVLASSLSTEYLGLSLAMGAFIAGLLVAETEYQHMVEEIILPFKDLLMGLFFMTIGMSLNIEIIYNNLFIITLITIALILIKATIIMALSRIFKFPLGSAIHTGLILSQGSEFAFVLFNLAAQDGYNLISKQTAEILLLTVTLSMALTPLLSALGKSLSQELESSEDLDHISFDDINDIRQHVVIVGYNVTSEMVANLLKIQKINYIILEADSKKAKQGRKRLYPVYHGDANKLDCLQSLNVDKAKAVIITLADNLMLKKAVRSINRFYPHLPIVVRSEDLSQAQSLKRIGATSIVPEQYESGLQLAGELLKAVGVSPYEISKLKNQFRASNYELTKDIIQSHEI